MTLAANTLLTTRTLTLYVRIYTTLGTYTGPSILLLPDNPTSSTGTPGVVGVRVSKSFDSPVPVCTLDLSRVPTWIKRGQGVTVDIGYNGLTQRIFTGFIQSRERKVGAGAVNCMGRLWTAFRTVQIGQRDVDGDTVATAIGDILDYVGLTDNRSLVIPSFTLGTASSPVLERMPASQMLQMLMDIDGCRIYETGSGQVIVKVIDELPAPTAYKTYTSNDNSTARVLEGSDREDPEYYRNRVIVTGATVTEGSAPDQTSRTITATATVVGSTLVQPALPSGTFVDAEYNNHLIDTDAKAADVAIRLLNKFARIPRQIVIELAGDPELELGQTVAFVMPELDLNDRGFISGIEHQIDSSGYVTRLTDFRGAGDTGGTLSQNPIAAFTFRSEIEVYGDVVQVVAALDASNSFDPDGTIVSYDWSDNQANATTPSIDAATTKMVVVRADTSTFTGSWDVTLTVTDNDGLTGAVTITVPYTNTEAGVTLPAIYAALNNNASASMDGGVTWKDVSGSTCISVGARPSDGVNVGHACYGFSNGVIKRTTDGGATLTTVMTSAAGVAINDIQWDWRNTLVVWALDENCILYISLDAGVTWAIYDSLRTKLSLAGALGNKIGLPVDGVYVWGGTGAGSPLIAYDPLVGSHGWVTVALTGDVKTDTIDTPGDNTLRIVDYTVGLSYESMILTWSSGGGASITAVYSCTIASSPPGPTRAFSRASTTFGGLKSGRWIANVDPISLVDQYYCAFANRSVWGSTDGIAWTETTNVMPVGVTPWHCLNLHHILAGGIGIWNMFIIAASDGIYKWTSGEATASYLRPSAAGATWPASAIGKKVSIGAAGATDTSASSNLIVTSNTTPKKITWFNYAALTWHSLVSLPAGLTANSPRPFALTSTLWFVSDRDSTWVNMAAAIARSTDGGLTWGTAAVGDEDGTHSGIEDVILDAAGNVWGCRHRDTVPAYVDIYKSADLGATWGTAKHTKGDGSTGSYGGTRGMFAHPTNSNIVGYISSYSFVIGESNGWCIYTTDGGTTWVEHHFTEFIPNNSRSNITISYGLRMFNTGRLIIGQRQQGDTTSHLKIWVSDDYGATWTNIWTDTQSEGDQHASFSGVNPLTGKCVAFLGDPDAAKSYPAWSLDYGATWTVGTAAAEDAFSADVTGIYGSLYDYVNDALYVFDDTSGHQIYRFAPVSASGVWTNVTYSQPATMGAQMEAFIP